MLTPLLTPLCFEWLLPGRVVAKPVCPSPRRASTQSVAGHDAPDFFLLRLFFPSTLFILLLKSLSNFPQTLILLILSYASPWYVFYLLF